MAYEKKLDLSAEIYLPHTYLTLFIKLSVLSDSRVYALIRSPPSSEEREVQYGLRVFIFICVLYLDRPSLRKRSAFKRNDRQRSHSRTESIKEKARAARKFSA